MIAQGDVGWLIGRTGGGARFAAAPGAAKPEAPEGMDEVGAVGGALETGRGAVR